MEKRGWERQEKTKERVLDNEYKNNNWVYIYLCVCVCTDKIMKQKNTKLIYDKFNKIKTFSFNPSKIYLWFYEISRTSPQK